MSATFGNFEAHHHHDDAVCWDLRHIIKVTFKEKASQDYNVYQKVIPCIALKQ